MNIDTLRSLQQRIREATGPDRELDADICAALRWGPNTKLHSFVFKFPLWAARSDGRVEVLNDDGSIVGHFKSAELTSDPDGLGACVALLRSVLPGYAWKVGTCCVSDDAWVVPDFNCPVHGARLREKFGEIEHGSIWDTGIDIDRRPSGNVCLALLDGIFSALIAEEEAKEKADADTR